MLSRDRLRAVIAAALRPELEQATLCIGIVAAILAYLLWYLASDGAPTPQEYEVLSVVSGFLAFSVLLTIAVVAAPRRSVPCRFIGMIGDNAFATYFMSQTGEGGAVIFFVYLFITIGNGFRFGRLYLHASQLMGLVGFSVVLAISPFWSQHIRFGASLLITLVLVPLYVGVLTERIKRERDKAEEALKQCVEREQRGS